VRRSPVVRRYPEAVRPGAPEFAGRQQRQAHQDEDALFNLFHVAHGFRVNVQMLKTDAIAVNLQHDGTLEKGNGQHEAQALLKPGQFPQRPASAPL